MSTFSFSNPIPLPVSGLWVFVLRSEGDTQKANVRTRCVVKYNLPLRVGEVFLVGVSSLVEKKKFFFFTLNLKFTPIMSSLLLPIHHSTH